MTDAVTRYCNNKLMDVIQKDILFEHFDVANQIIDNYTKKSVIWFGSVTQDGTDAILSVAFNNGDKIIRTIKCNNCI
jgi:hypothetical protein